MTLLLILVFLVCSILCIKIYFAVIDSVPESEADSNALKKEFRAAMRSEDARAFAEKMEARGIKLADELLKLSNSNQDCLGISPSFPREFDIVLDAAGFRGQVALGAWSVLRRLQEKEAIKVVVVPEPEPEPEP